MPALRVRSTVSARVPAEQRDSEALSATAHKEAGSEASQELDTCQPQAQAQPPTSPSLVQLVSQPLLEAKDRRAYEVARQRAKRPKDRRKARNQKAKVGVLAGAGAGAGGTRDRTGQADFESVDDKEEEAIVYTRKKTSCDADSKSKAGSNLEKPEVVVHLEDLIRVAKVRRAKAGDFEVIPHVRAVIALDDADFGDESGAIKKIPDFDGDDWEHVESESTTSSSDEDEQSKAPSYAQVVSTTKQ